MEIGRQSAVNGVHGIIKGEVHVSCKFNKFRKCFAKIFILGFLQEILMRLVITAIKTGKLNMFKI